MVQRQSVLEYCCWFTGCGCFGSYSSLQMEYFPGVNQKFKGSGFFFRLQLPILALIFIQLFWIWTLNMILPEKLQTGLLILKFLSSLILLVLIPLL
ncbi:MAG: hypothetical protein Ct9H300mP28_28220 [Pseudomonadota bacterium]|nr:MAG: hypothetical protein Ct9H300mP28_28220 [Pseudomonadota bacterium]